MERIDQPKQPVAQNGHVDDQAGTEAQPPTNGSLTVDDKIKEEIKLAKDWVETVGLQSM
jgi:hypothetical protein